MNTVKPLNTINYYVSKSPINPMCTRTIRELSNLRTFDGFKLQEDKMYPKFRIDNSILDIIKDILLLMRIEIKPL